MNIFPSWLWKIAYWIGRPKCMRRFRRWYWQGHMGNPRGRWPWGIVRWCQEADDKMNPALETPILDQIRDARLAKGDVFDWLDEVFKGQPAKDQSKLPFPLEPDEL